MRFLRRSERGQGLAEFALALPVLLLVILSVFDIGRAVFIYNSITNAAREGARLAIVNQTEASIDQRVIEQAGGIETDVTKVDVTYWSAGPNADPLQNAPCNGVGSNPPLSIGCVAVVDYEASWRAITPVIGSILGPITMHSRAALPIEFMCPNSTTAAGACPKQP